MGWGIAVLGIVQAISLFLQPRAAAADALSPLLSSFYNVSCDAVGCGMGNCKVSSDHTFGFVCECDPGWTKLQMSEHFQFLPCVVPNCTFNYSCYHDTAAPAPPLPALPSNNSIFDPCKWSICGEGTCVRTTTFGHRCECKMGYNKLLNVTYFPCLKECALGADCPNLGIGLSNGSSSSSPPNLSDSGHSPSRAPENFLWSAILVISLAIVQGT